MSDTKIEQPPIWNLPVSASMGSETGRREENQDRVSSFSSPFGMVYLVADGMGGHKGGADAAQMTAEGFQRCLLALPADTPYLDAVSFAASEIHQSLTALGSSGDPNFSGMGSTVVLALIRQVTDGFELVAAHMGDSRLYLHRAGQLTLLTRDHTQVQWLVDANEIDEAAARSHPDASVLTRALGHGAHPVIDVSEPIPLGDGDGILLCSDGLSGFVASEDIDRTIKQFPEPAECVHALIQLALDRGSNDNVTVQFLRVGNQPAPILPVARQGRRTEPEGPAYAAAPAYREQSRPIWRSPLLAGLAIGLVLAVVAIVLYSLRLSPSHPAAPAAIPAEDTIGDLSIRARKLWEKGKQAEDEVTKLLEGLSKSGAADAETRRKLKALKVQIHELNSALREIPSSLSRLSPKQTEPVVAKTSVDLNIKEQTLSKLQQTLREIQGLAPVLAPPDNPQHKRKP
jgi:protein phosphatase